MAGFDADVEAVGRGVADIDAGRYVTSRAELFAEAQRRREAREGVMGCARCDGRGSWPSLPMPELLAPARDREAFLAALAAGADAIYCGVAGGLNARRRAAGLGEEELAELCALAHERGARVYVTANVVVKASEMAGALAAIEREAATGVDAFIIQDLGLMAEVAARMPEVEIHVSTQANVHDACGVALMAELGASRVTLSRELSLAEIASIARSERARAEALSVAPCELEVFAHGAICPSYSGVCMLSSYLREGRSPNRGLCAQPCRLPFDLVDERGKRLQTPELERALCTHDNCAIDDVRALAEAGIASYKIEGRMKPAAYVHAVVSAWRGEIDAVAAARGGAGADGCRDVGSAPADGEGLRGGEAEEAVAKARRRVLKRSFNRDFTNAYLHGRAGNELMSYERSGNRGELVGEVVAFEPEPGFVPRDGQQIRGEVLVELRAPVEAGDSLELRHPAEPERFMVVTVEGAAEAGSVLRCCVPRPMPAGCEARVTKSAALERAAADAVAGMERLAEERADGARPACDAEHARDEAGIAAVAAECHEVAGEEGSAKAPAKPELCALVANLADAEKLCEAGAEHIYLDVSGLEPTGELVAEARERGYVPVLSEVCREGDRAGIDPWIGAGAPVAVGNVSELALAREREALPEVRTCIPVHNGSAAAELVRLGARGIWLSPELSLEEIAQLAGCAAPTGLRPWVGVVVYGRPRLMTCEHCVLQVAYACDHSHATCSHRRREHALVNIDGRRLPVRTDAHGRSRVYLDEPLNLESHVADLVAAGVSRLLVDATTTSVEDAVAALRRIASVLDGQVTSDAPGVMANDGLLLSGVE